MIDGNKKLSQLSVKSLSRILNKGGEEKLISLEL